MSENTLITAFVIFTMFLFFAAVFLRKMNMRDVFDDNVSSPFEKSSILQRRFSTRIKNPALSTLSQKKKSSTDDRQKVYKIAKLISTLGIIVLFIPLPEVYRFVGLAFAFIGSMVAKVTAPPKIKTSKRPVAQAEQDPNKR